MSKYLILDCDGGRLTDSSICCPAADVVDCNNDTRYSCKTNHGGKSRNQENDKILRNLEGSFFTVMIQTGANHAVEFNYMDLRR